ncbi:MAG: hypothetical protein FJ272_20250 [Planctomycetes bacterium]|nr:hypothetical protein [Planctomycetota bacterium]
MTWDQVAGRKRRAVAFIRDVLGDETRADEVEQESLADYAIRRGFTAAENPNRRSNNVATVKDLEKEIADLEEALESVQDTLEGVYTPEASREALASAVGEALDTIEDALGEEEEEEEDLEENPSA